MESKDATGNNGVIYQEHDQPADAENCAENTTALEENQPKTCPQRCVGCCKAVGEDNILLICLIVSMAAGIGMGLGLRTLSPPMDKREIMYLNFPGDLLMRMLKFLILPLIVSSLVAGR